VEAIQDDDVLVLCVQFEFNHFKDVCIECVIGILGIPDSADNLFIRFLRPYELFPHRHNNSRQSTGSS
jgi:hypothetical protein